MANLTLMMKSACERLTTELLLIALSAKKIKQWIVMKGNFENTAYFLRLLCENNSLCKIGMYTSSNFPSIEMCVA